MRLVGCATGACFHAQFAHPIRVDRFEVFGPVGVTLCVTTSFSSAPSGIWLTHVVAMAVVMPLTEVRAVQQTKCLIKGTLPAYVTRRRRNGVCEPKHRSQPVHC